MKHSAEVGDRRMINRYPSTRCAEVCFSDACRVEAAGLRLLQCGSSGISLVLRYICRCLLAMHSIYSHQTVRPERMGRGVETVRRESAVERANQVWHHIWAGAYCGIHTGGLGSPTNNLDINAFNAPNHRSTPQGTMCSEKAYSIPVADEFHIRRQIGTNFKQSSEKSVEFYW